jgi:hypothetical protein
MFSFTKNTLMRMTMIAMLIFGATAPGFADPVGGRKYTRTSVNANSEDVFRVTFRGGELARVALSGDGDTDLDLYVYDENGSLIAKDDDSSDDCYVSWVPRWTSSFKIRVVNRGRVYNEYVLIAY